MPAAKKMPHEAQEEVPSLCRALGHPLRTRIVEVANEMPISPSGFVRQGLVPAVYYDHYKQALSAVAYHFSELEKEGCLSLVETNPRRGATEHVYRGASRVFFSDREFEDLPFDVRSGLSKASFQGVVARTDGAIRAGTFDHRLDRHLTWRAFMSDEQGWDEMTDILADAYYKLEEARTAAEERLVEKNEEGFPATFAMLGFESPPIPLRF
ncbi:MAG TPA: hypothetical protein VGB06_08215 [Solirubrobacterales bacterium]|jgi:hypothetical protein